MSDRQTADEYKIADAQDMLVKTLPPLDVPAGVYLRQVIMPEWGLNTARLARLLNLNRSNLHGVLTGQKDLTRELAYRVGALLNDHVADLLIAYQHQWDLQQERPRREQLKAEIAQLPQPS